MAAESHKELQKCGHFGDWMRKDIQYSQFQNYELTYAHFVRFPSWERWPPGSSPGRNFDDRTKRQIFKTNNQVIKSNNQLFFLVLCFLTLSTNIISNIVSLPTITKKLSKKSLQNLYEQKIIEPIRIWSGSLAISWVTFAHIFQSIKFDLICSQWRSKISWYCFWKPSNPKYIISKISSIL